MITNDARSVEDAAPESQDAVLEHCSKCSTLLDVTGCHPLMETACPSCGSLIKVLREFHHFVLLSEIGHGGAGTVYRAFDETLERDVALKLLRPENTRDAEYLAGLETEALITASINHSHVVKVYSTGRKNGLYYIAMEIVGGGSLADRLDRQGRLPETTVHSLGIQLAEGLHAAYERGLLHRDVKPGNVLFADQDTIKVADFGLAMPLEQARGNSSTEIWGTPDYIAPEKLLQEGEDIRSDIYSVGCTLYHCLTGRPPFDPTTVQTVIQKQAAQPAPSVQVLASDVSGATAFVIQRCLEKNPADRYQSYHELIEHLKYAREQVVQAGPATSNSQPSAPGRESARKPWLWPAIAAALVVLAVAGMMLVPKRSSAKAVGAAGEVKSASLSPQVAAPAKTVPPAKPAEYRIVDLRSACTADTRKGIFQGPRVPTDTLVFAQYGIIKANGIPFELIDPARSPSGFNVSMLKGSSLPYPKKVEVRMSPQPVRKLHFLGGIAGWGWTPDKNKEHFGQPVVKFTVLHVGGASEEFQFKDGVEFANHTTRVDVPGSTYAPGVTINGHQVRTFSVELTQQGPVERLVIESLHATVAPVFVAITAELADR